MVYPVTTIILSQTLKDLDARMESLKTQCDRWIADMASTIQTDEILHIWLKCHRDHAYFTLVKDTPGLMLFARDEKNDNSLNITAEINTLLPLLQAVWEWHTVGGNVETVGVGWIKVHKLDDVSGLMTERNYTTTETVALLPLVQAVSDQIS